jgi:hypothetical protein
MTIKETKSRLNNLWQIGPETSSRPTMSLLWEQTKDMLQHEDLECLLSLDLSWKIHPRMDVQKNKNVSKKLTVTKEPRNLQT